jgi:hypothetical protein
MRHPTRRTDDILQRRINHKCNVKNKRHSLLIDEQMIIGWDNILRGKFTKQWKIQQQAYITRQ